MLPLEHVRDLVIDKCAPKPAVMCPIADALGLVTASDIIAAEDIPQFANTAMDGFAVRAADLVDPPVRLEVVETVAAGHAPTRHVGPGQAARIMTGAIVPPGADAIVMVERTRTLSAPADRELVEIQISVPSGNHVRPAGDDIGAGTRVFGTGTVLSAGHIGVLASLGLTAVQVRPRLRVGVISTGDELVDDASALQPGQIRDSNRVTLLSLLARTDVIPVNLGLVPDDETRIADAIRDGVSRCDAIVTSGGVSMGDYDYVKAVLDRIGDMAWMQVAIKPAKPFAFGDVDGVPVFGLPGNPVSSMVSYELFARTGLRSMMGHRPPQRPPVSAVAAEALPRSPDGKTHFMRVKAAHSHGRIEVRSAGGQGSHMLWAMAQANALAVVPDGDGIAAGSPVDVLLLDD